MCVFVIMAIFTTSGTFMLLFLAALQNIDDSINEAAELDGANEWRKFRHITLPMIRPTIFTIADARPDRHLADLRPDLRRDEGQSAEHDADAGVPLVQRLVQHATNGASGAALAFILFAIIVFFTVITRILTGTATRCGSGASDGALAFVGIRSEQ